MKIKEIISEEPMASGDLRPMADNFARSFISNLDKIRNRFKHIGDIDSYKIYSADSIYFLELEGIVKAIFRIENATKYGIDDVWIAKDTAGQRLFSKILWFLVSRLKLTPLYFGNIHSQETYNIIKWGGFKKFKKSWVNKFTDEEISFSLDTMDDFYGSTKWRLKLEPNKKLQEIIEEVENSIYNMNGWIRTNYDWQLDYIDEQT